MLRLSSRSSLLRLRLLPVGAARFASSPAAGGAGLPASSAAASSSPPLPTAADIVEWAAKGASSSVEPAPSVLKSRRYDTIVEPPPESVATAAPQSAADSAVAGAGSAPSVPQPGPILVDPSTGAVSAPGAQQPLTTVPIPEQPLTTVPIPVGPQLPGAEALPVDTYVPGFFFGTNGVFAFPMRCVEGLLTTIHDTTGAPWWLSIVVATVTVRTAFFPLMVMQQRNVHNMQQIKPQMDDLTNKMKAAYNRGEKGLNDSIKYQNQLQALMIKHGVAPWRTMITAIVQIPVWMSFFFTLRGILGRPNDAMGFGEGGTLWFPDLTAADPYYILPVSCGATFYFMASLDPSGAPIDDADEQKARMRTGMKVMAVAMVPLTASFESGVFVYWTTSNALTVGQTALLRMPAARAAIGMPPLPVPATPAALGKPVKPLSDKPFVPELTLATPPPAATAAAPATAATTAAPPPRDEELTVESGVRVAAPVISGGGKGKGKGKGKRKSQRR